MAVFRIEKTRDYTVMSNHHLKDRTLTLKSKGLLSMMLSLPDEWNYTTRGLAAICREGVDSIGAALKELETHGYIRRTQLRDEKGKITDTEYVIYEMPQCEPPSSPGTPLPGTAKPYTENPDMGIPDTADPCTENPAQLNTNQIKTDLSSTEISNHIPSNPPTPAGARMGTDRMGARECYREVILDSLMFNIALALVLSWDDDRQTVFLAKLIRGAADIVIASLIGMIVLVIRKADRIENQVVMNMILVYVGGKYKFILTAQDFFCKLYAYFMGLFRRDLSRLKGLDQVTAQVRSLADGVAAGPGKFDIRSFGGAAIGGYKQLSVRLFRVADIVNGCFQR